MSSELTVDIRGLEAVEHKLTNPALIAGPLRLLLNDLSLLGQRVARQEAPKDTRALAREIFIDVQPLFSRVYTNLNYAPVMEYGRKPGTPIAYSLKNHLPTRWSGAPPQDALAGWARRHGFNGSLFVLAQAIARRGIKGRFFMAKAKTAVEAALPGKLDQMAKRIEQLWGQK